jgi:hypothetical protein
MIDANCTSGAVALRNSTMASAGEVVDPGNVTTLTHAMGLYGETVTYTATPTTDNHNVMPKPTGLTGVCRVISHPLTVCEFRVAGSATSGTALANTVASRSNILTNTAADATNLIVTSAGVSTVSFVGGYMKGRTGANKGQTRVIITHNNGADERVEVAFLNDIAVGDTFTAVAFSKKVTNMQMTTDFTEANGIIATGTGGVAAIYDVLIGVDDVQPGSDTVLVQVIFRDHWFKSLA